LSLFWKNDDPGSQTMITPQKPNSPPAAFLRIITRSPEETRRLGEIIGLSVHENEKLIITLTGDLGAGKTVFVQGLARGLDVPSDYYITSPTYTLINEYPGRVRLAHADLYRISAAGDLADIGLEEISVSTGVLAIEWASRLGPDELEEDLSIAVTAPNEAADGYTDESTRNWELFFYGRPKTNLIDQLKTTFSGE